MHASKAQINFIWWDFLRAGFVVLLFLQEKCVLTWLCSVIFELCIPKDTTCRGFEYMGWLWYKYWKYCALTLTSLLCLCSCPVSTELWKSILLVLTHLLMVVVSGSFVHMGKEACEIVAEDSFPAILELINLLYLVVTSMFQEDMLIYLSAWNRATARERASEQPFHSCPHSTNAGTL